jgi:hypothetical protein
MRIRSAATLTALALLSGIVFLGLGTAPALAKGKPCWERVIDDWLDNGTIDGKYSTACYRQALQNVPEDLRDYSNVGDAIALALNASLRTGSSTGNGPTGNGTTGKGDSTRGDENRTPQAVPSSPYRRALDKLGTTSADSLPIPLLVLAGLGTALLLSAGGLAVHKRLKARPRPPA